MSQSPQPKLESLPVEVIIDNILPFLPVSSIASLSATSKFFYLLASDETFWKRRLLTDYNFSGNDTARTTGWKFIYGRLARPKVYVWGEGSRRRLGFKPRDLPRTSVYEGVPYPVQLHLPRGVKIVSLSAGGMSFHALDSQGRVWVWGTLDGTSFLTQADSFADKHKPAASPTLLELPFSIRTISCGRLHSAALTTSSQVLNFTSWGRPFVLHSRHFTSSLASLSPSTPSTSSSTTNPTLHTHLPPSTPIQVECGWAFTAVLTSTGNVFVYWPHENGRDRLGRLIYRKNEEWNAQGVGLAKLQGDDSSDNDFPRIPCHVWSVDAENPDDAYTDASGRVVRQEEGLIMVKLPDLEEYDLPKISTDGQDGEEDKESTKIVKIAGLDNAVVGLTNKGHVVMFRGLEGQETAVTPGNRWRYLPYFSEVEKVREDPVWTDEKYGLQPPEKMKISHISGNYKTFTTYSPNPGVVLMGNIDSDPSLHHPLTISTTHPLPPPSPFKPTILPTLQHPHNTVISVVLGDYHYGALTSSGHLLTWGSFSKGALGLGDPNDLDVGVPGGFGSQQEKDESLRETRLRRYGIEPERTDVPGVVRFDWEDRKRGAKGKERYCFGATAAGWHMGALVIDLEPDTDETEAEEEHPEANMPGAFPDSDTPEPEDNYPNVPVIPLLGRGINPFRIGFAGRAGRGGPHGRYRPLGRGNIPDEA